MTARPYQPPIELNENQRCFDIITLVNSRGRFEVVFVEDGTPLYADRLLKILVDERQYQETMQRIDLGENFRFIGIEGKNILIE